MEITITIGGPLADAINNLSSAIQAAGLIERSSAPKAPKPKAKTEPVAPVPAPSEPVPTPTATELPPVEATVSTDPEPATLHTITSYEQLRSHVAPLLASPVTKAAVTKLVKKYCDGNLKDIKTSDYPAVLAALSEISK